MVCGRTGGKPFCNNMLALNMRLWFVLILRGAKKNLQFDE